MQRLRSPHQGILIFWSVFLFDDPVMELSESLSLLKMYAELYVCVFMKYEMLSRASSHALNSRTPRTSECSLV